MIVGYIKGQSLSLSSPTIASGTIDHLTACFTFFTSEWEQCNEIWVHFSQGDTVYDAEIIEGKVSKDQHINLDKGEWEVYVHGNVTANGEVVERITTEKETLFVQESGIVDGTPFPSVEASTAEKLLAKAEYAIEIAEGVREDFDDIPTGGGLTPEQESEIQANTAARHTHANKNVIDKFSTFKAGATDFPQFDGWDVWCASHGYLVDSVIVDEATGDITLAIRKRSVPYVLPDEYTIKAPPTKTSQLENDSGFVTAEYVTAAINGSLDEIEAMIDESGVLDE